MSIEEKPNDEPGLFGALFMLFIALFFIPIMWLGEKIKGNGVGFGPAFASFIAATAIVMMAVLTIAVGVGLGLYVLLS